MNQASKWLSDSLRKSLLGISIASKVVRIFTSSVSSYYRIVMVFEDYFVSHGHIYLGTKLTQPIMIAEIDALQPWFFAQFHQNASRISSVKLWVKNQKANCSRFERVVYLKGKVMLNIHFILKNGCFNHQQSWLRLVLHYNF